MMMMMMNYRRFRPRDSAHPITDKMGLLESEPHLHHVFSDI